MVAASASTARGRRVCCSLARTPDSGDHHRDSESELCHCWQCWSGPWRPIIQFRVLYSCPDGRPQPRGPPVHWGQLETAAAVWSGLLEDVRQHPRAGMGFRLAEGRRPGGNRHQQLQSYQAFGWMRPSPACHGHTMVVCPAVALRRTNHGGVGADKSLRHPTHTHIDNALPPPSRNTSPFAFLSEHPLPCPPLFPIPDWVRS